MIINGTERLLLTRANIAEVTNISKSYLDANQFWLRPSVAKFGIKVGNRKWLYKTEVLGEVIHFLKEGE